MEQFEYISHDHGWQQVARLLDKDADILNLEVQLPRSAEIPGNILIGGKSRGSAAKVGWAPGEYPYWRACRKNMSLC